MTTTDPLTDCAGRDEANSDGDATSPNPIIESVLETSLDQDVHAAKRQRKTRWGEFKYVRFRGCNRMRQTVAINLDSLCMYGSSLCRLIEYDAPRTHVEIAMGEPFWDTNHTHEILESVALSVAHGVVECSGAAEPKCVLRALEMYAMPCNADGVAPHGAAIRAGRESHILLRTTEERVASRTRLAAYCASVAHALVTWPTLGRAAAAVYDGYQPFAIGTHSAWIRFVAKPPLIKIDPLAISTPDEGSKEFVSTLCHDWPKWLQDMLGAAMYITDKHVTQLRGGEHGVLDWNEQEQISSLQHLERTIDPSLHFGGPYWATEHDATRPRVRQEVRGQHRMNMHGPNDRLTRVRLLVRHIRSLGMILPWQKKRCIDASGLRDVDWACKIVRMLHISARDCPHAATIFSAVCAPPTEDESGLTPARDALACALNKYGVRIRAWRSGTASHANFLAFPPAWTQAGDDVGDTPSLLLEWA
jgi:hypothetical protein